MRKIFSLLAAVLFAGSMMASEVDITPANCGWSATAGSQTGTAVSGVTISVTKGLASSGQNPDQIRIYKGETLTVSATSVITSIVFTCTANGTAQYGPGCFAAQTGYTYEASGKTGTWTGSASSVTFKAESAQVRATKIVVTTDDGTVAVHYYVAGSMNDWKANGDYELVENPGQQGEYWGLFSFAADDELKVIGVAGDETTWFPQGTGNNWQITKGGMYYVYFRPEGNSQWANNYFYVAAVPTYNIAEAIAANPSENDAMYVIGVVTKIEIKGKNFKDYGSACIYVKDATGAAGEFEFYNCHSFDGQKFTTTDPAYNETSTTMEEFESVSDGINTVSVGDTVKAFGKYQFYSTTSMHELQTNCYIVEIIEGEKPEPETIEVNMSEGLYYRDCVEAEGWWQIYGDNAQYTVSISNVSTTQAEGTYTFADLDADYTYVGIINGEDTTYIDFKSGSVTLSIAQNGDITVAGTLMGKDNNNYAFNLVFVTPKAQTTVNVTITNAELYDEYAEDGLYGVYGLDANDIYVQIAIWAEDGLQGQFSDQDLDFQYVGTYIEDGDEYVEIYSATITVDSGEEGGYTVTATLVGYNNKEYNVVMTIPVVTTGIAETIAAGKAAKVLRNGQLLIMKGDKTFNMTGARIR